MHPFWHTLAVLVVVALAFTGLAYFIRSRNGGRWPWQEDASTKSTRPGIPGKPPAPK